MQRQEALLLDERNELIAKIERAKLKEEFARCRHKFGFVNNVCISCGNIIILPQQKYNCELRRMLLKDENKQEVKDEPNIP